MNEDDRKHLYASLLRGIGEECQNRLCAADEQHAWGDAVATDHWPDIPLVPFNAAKAINVKVMRSYRRECLNCRKVEQL